MRDYLYCLPCRTCPHGHTYYESWLPACNRCVRDLHTLMTHDGPRIRNVALYVEDAIRWGLFLIDVHPHTFAEMEEIAAYVDAARFPMYGVDRREPPHHLDR